MTKKKKQTAEEKKTQFTRIGLALSGIAINDATAELIWRFFKKMEELKGQFSIHDGVKLELFIREKYKLGELTRKIITSEKTNKNNKK